MKLYYNDNGNKILLAEVMTNHSMSIDDALNLAGIDMDEWAEEQGWDNWDYGALEMEW
jgi:metal-dependent HD superfamily phosphatase/phosphodiesterase